MRKIKAIPVIFRKFETHDISLSGQIPDNETLYMLACIVVAQLNTTYFVRPICARNIGSRYPDKMVFPDKFRITRPHCTFMY